MRGFGFQLDVASGRVRDWYSGADGIQRWADNDQPCSVMARLEQDFDKHFGLPPITPPDPLSATEASEGIVALTKEDTGNDD